MKEIIEGLLASIKKMEPAALATVVEVKGPSPAQVGFKLLVLGDGSAVGNVGGGALEQQVREDAISALEGNRSRLVHYALREKGPDAVGMLCGGEVTVFIEVCQPAPTLLIVGGGHIGRPLAEMARTVGFEVQVVDLRLERATAPPLDPAIIAQSTYVVVITERHVSDEQALRQILNTPAAYIGMIGSQRKAEIIFAHLRAAGMSEAQLARVRAPIGLDLGGRSPAEIALAILAQVVQIRNGGSGKPLALIPDAKEGGRGKDN
jgi:xanthine dehydrogenase accessory factor